jgi:ABC-2 type transport system permease protein
MLDRVRQIIIKEFIQIFRDPRMRTIIFVPPIVQMLIFGYAVSTDVKNIPTAIYDIDNSQESRDLTREFTRSNYFKATKYIFTDSEQKELINKSIVSAVVRFNPGFANDLNANRTAQMQLIIDGADSNTASVILAYANQIIEKYSSKRLHTRAKILLNSSGKFPEIELRTRSGFNENLLSRNFYIPGVIALIITIITLLLTSMAIVKEKEIGTIEQLMVSPINSWELILGKLLPFAIIGLADVLLVTVVGVLWFNVPIRGNLLLLLVSAIFYLLTTLGIGLFISTIANTQQEAMMTTFFFIFPAILLSGFAFPIYNMPKLIQYFTYINPIKYFLIIIRGIFLKGTGLEILWPQMVALFIIGCIILTLSTLRFQKRLG